MFGMDGMALADQRALLEPLLRARIIQRVTFSGSKSLHCIVEETDEPDASTGEEEYKFAWRWIALKYFKDRRFADYSLPFKTNRELPEVVDDKCAQPSRITKTPFGIRKDRKTGWKPVEQKLLYFENVRVDSGWRAMYNRAKEQEQRELERMRKRAAREAWKYRDREKKVPNGAARRFMGGDMSDGWKHASLGSAVASLKACGYGREEVAEIFRRYEAAGKKELLVYALHAYDYFERRDAGKAVDYFTRRNGPMTGGAAGAGASLAGEAAR